MRIANPSSIGQKKDLHIGGLGKAFDDIRRKFSNRRQWRDFAAAVQCPVTYAAAIHALRSATSYSFGD
jgi:hypothetical protein